MFIITHMLDRHLHKWGEAQWFHQTNSKSLISTILTRASTQRSCRTSWAQSFRQTFRYTNLKLLTVQTSTSFSTSQTPLSSKPNLQQNQTSRSIQTRERISWLPTRKRARTLAICSECSASAKVKKTKERHQNDEQTRMHRKLVTRMLLLTFNK